MVWYLGKSPSLLGGGDLNLSPQILLAHENHRDGLTQ